MKSLNEILQTRRQVFEEGSRVLVIVKPGFLDKSQWIINKMKRNGWTLAQMKSKILTMNEAKRLYYPHKDKDFYYKLCKYMTSGPSCAMVFHKDKNIGEKAFKKMDAIKDEIRQKWGETEMKNTIHSSDNEARLRREMSIYF